MGEIKFHAGRLLNLLHVSFHLTHVTELVVWEGKRSCCPSVLHSATWRNGGLVPSILIVGYWMLVSN